MTTLLYVEGDGLYSDSKHVRVTGNRQQILYHRKVFYTEDKSAIFGISGQFQYPRKQDHDRIVKEIIKEYGSTIRQGQPKILGSRLNTIIDGTLIIVTPEDGAYVYDAYEDVIYQLNGVSYYASGTGEPYLYAAMRLSGDPEFAVQWALDNDRCSGGDIHHVSIDKLIKSTEE